MIFSEQELELLVKAKKHALLIAENKGNLQASLNHTELSFVGKEDDHYLWLVDFFVRAYFCSNLSHYTTLSTPFRKCIECENFKTVSFPVDGEEPEINFCELDIAPCSTVNENSTYADTCRFFKEKTVEICNHLPNRGSPNTTGQGGSR